MKKIVVLDGYAANPGDISWEPLKESGEVVYYDRTPSEQIPSRIGDAEIVLTNKCVIGRDVMEKCPQMKYIGVLATGYNNIDTKEAAARGICVTNIPAYSTDSVAQIVFALLLEACHHVGAHSEKVHRGGWAACADFCFWDSPLIELKGKTFGIVGLGRIGRKVAEVAQVFGMRVLAATRTPKNIEGIAEVSMERLFEESDVISFHCPLTRETEGILCRENLAKMKDGVILINTGRGGLAQEEDVAEALDSGKAAWYLADVMTQEPPQAGSRLAEHPRSIVTPHIGWATREARIRLQEIMTENVRGYLTGNIRNQVN